MSRAARQPQLVPQFCFSTTALRDFLRTSRSSIDDSITQNLNGLIQPAGLGFDPSSTTSRQIRPSQRPLIDARSCQWFKDEVLFPSWQTRSDVLNYCALIAASPDPEDPESLLREAESARERERIVDERLDPYSGRFSPRETRTEVLAGIVRNERGVENIIRARTWTLVSDRCGMTGEGWEVALNEWRRRREDGQR
ncbi:MAG: hypothetical protein M1838_002674 [Thelocarpon superellum]|nr:MAG: hypothetical protein M1838_002674 [Thelocarpon superellum]